MKDVGLENSPQQLRLVESKENCRQLLSCSRSTQEKKKVFHCAEEYADEEFYDVTMMVKVDGVEETAILDTAGTSVLVNYAWFTDREKVAENDVEGATAADRRSLSVMGRGRLLFQLWGCKRTETVRLSINLPLRILIGARFMKGHHLKIEMHNTFWSTIMKGRR